MTQNQDLNLTVYPRDGVGKGVARKTRKTDRIPSVVYGRGQSSFPVALAPVEFRKTFTDAGRTAMVTLRVAEGAPKELDGQKILFKEIQMHPFKDKVLHVDLNQIDLSQKLRVVVPIEFVGEPKGLADGGVLQIMAREIEVKCLPHKIPEHIEVDISGLDINENIGIEEVEKLFESNDAIEFMYESAFALAGVAEPRKEEPEPVAAEGEAAAGDAAPAAAAANGEKSEDK